MLKFIINNHTNQKIINMPSDKIKQQALLFRLNKSKLFDTLSNQNKFAKKSVHYKNPVQSVHYKTQVPTILNYKLLQPQIWEQEIKYMDVNSGIFPEFEIIEWEHEFNYMNFNQINIIPEFEIIKWNHELKNIDSFLNE